MTLETSNHMLHLSPTLVDAGFILLLQIQVKVMQNCIAKILSFDKIIKSGAQHQRFYLEMYPKPTTKYDRNGNNAYSIAYSKTTSLVEIL